MLQVSLSLEEQVEYYNCGDYPFNFQLTKLLSTPPSALEVKRAIESFLLMVPTDRQSNWLVSMSRAQKVVNCNLSLAVW